MSLEVRENREEALRSLEVRENREEALRLFNLLWADFSDILNVDKKEGATMTQEEVDDLVFLVSP